MLRLGRAPLATLLVLLAALGCDEDEAAPSRTPPPSPEADASAPWGFEDAEGNVALRLVPRAGGFTLVDRTGRVVGTAQVEGRAVELVDASGGGLLARARPFSGGVEIDAGETLAATVRFTPRGTQVLAADGTELGVVVDERLLRAGRPVSPPLSVRGPAPKVSAALLTLTELTFPVRVALVLALAP